MSSVFTSIGTYCHARAVWRQLSLPLQAPPFFGAGWVADGCKGVAGLWCVLARGVAPCTMRPVEGA